MTRRHAMIIPVVCPITENMATPASIDDLIGYDELKHATRYRLAINMFNLREEKRRLRMGAFAQLNEGFEGHDVVFLHPYEVVRILQAGIVVSNNDSVTFLDNIRAGEELEERLAEIWYIGNAIIVSNYIADALVDNLTVQYRRVLAYEYTYCYGRIKRVVRKLDVKKVLEESNLVAAPPTHLDDEQRAKMVYEFLVYTRTHWPWMTYGLIVDRTRSWIAVLNPDTMGFIKVCDIEELRELRYGGRPIPLIVVKKLTLAKRPEKLLIESQSRLDTLLSYLILRYHMPLRWSLLRDVHEI